MKIRYRRRLSGKYGGRRFGVYVVDTELNIVFSRELRELREWAAFVIVVGKVESVCGPFA